MKSKTVYFILTVILFFSYESVRAQSSYEEYFTPANILEFAEKLLQEEDYLRAAGEFQRYLFKVKESSVETDEILYKTGLCYYSINKYEKAFKYFNEVIDEHKDSYFKDLSILKIGHSYFLDSKYMESNSYLKSAIKNIRSNDVALKTNTLIGLNYLYLKEWESTISYLDTLDKNLQNSGEISLLKHYAKRGKSLPKKSSITAGLLSSIIPGTGKMYCNRFNDGLFSLLLVGITAWRSYEGFKDNSPARGWLFGTVSAVFYLGNIYGSVISAQIYNNEAENGLFSEIHGKINVYFN